MVEHSAVNRRVVGSSPTRGATSEQAPHTIPHHLDGVFVCFSTSSTVNTGNGPYEYRNSQKWIAVFLLPERKGKHGYFY